MAWITLQALHAALPDGGVGGEAPIGAPASRHAERDSPQGAEDLARITGVALM
ncbi:hypothetical protein [Nesterenkonia halobia]|uniref:hypothetical protein n=1 Tax=Nesterenkonia halobia TaxID=37922 RepID=UPI0031D34509